MAVQNDPNSNGTLSSTQTRPELQSADSFFAPKPAARIPYAQRAARGVGFYTPQQLGYEPSIEQSQSAPAINNNPFLTPEQAQVVIQAQTPDMNYSHSPQLTESQPSSIQAGQIYVAERQEPKPLNRDAWKINWDGGIMASILAIGSVAVDVTKDAVTKTAQFAAKQISAGAKQVGNTLDMSALLGFKPAAPENKPAVNIYSTAEQHAQVALFGTATQEKPVEQVRALQNTRQKLNRLMQEGKHAKAVLQKDDRRIVEAQQAVYDNRVANKLRAFRKVSRRELEKDIPNSHHDVMLIMALRDEQRNGGKAQMQDLREPTAVQSKGMLGKAKKKVQTFMSSIGIKGSQSERGAVEVGPSIGS